MLPTPGLDHKGVRNPKTVQKPWNRGNGN